MMYVLIVQVLDPIDFMLMVCHISHHRFVMNRFKKSVVVCGKRPALQMSTVELQCKRQKASDWLGIYRYQVSVLALSEPKKEYWYRWWSMSTGIGSSIVN